MRTYFEKLEHNSYLPAKVSGHGYNGWLYTEQPPLSVPFSDSKILAMTYAAAQTVGSAVVGPIVNTIAGLTSLLQNQGDMNRDTPDRDSKFGMFQIPIHTHQGVRNTPREFVLNTMASGAPLDFLPNSLVTKVLFDNSSGTPVATGVEYMRGQSLYQAGVPPDDVVSFSPLLTFTRSSIQREYRQHGCCPRSTGSHSLSRYVVLDPEIVHR